MKFGVLGTGMVGQTIATKLVELGHEVKMGSRQAGNERARGWVEQADEGASEGSFADAAGFGEMVFNCTAGTASVEAVGLASRDALKGKILIDLANRLQMGSDGPEVVIGELSLGEELQQALPETRVVKTLNTVNHHLMVQPSLLSEPHTMFIAGDDPQAKSQVSELLESFGWPGEQILDLGDITGARGMELYLPLWIRLYQVTQAPQFNAKLVMASG